ncbi:MAG TPA: hypothetical protein PLW02_11570 [Verrucomicrobiota bacterium]|nr:hypothetical protein [Verrucomicrobiota bacterium]
MGNNINDGRGRIIGIKSLSNNGWIYDKHGHPVARYNASTNDTIAADGRYLGKGDLRMVELGRRLAEEENKNKK